VGGNAEIVRAGISGLVVPSGDADALAAAMKTLRTDRTNKEAMGRAACLRVRERYSLQGMVCEYAALYRLILPT